MLFISYIVLYTNEYGIMNTGDHTLQLAYFSKIILL